MAWAWIGVSTAGGLVTYQGHQHCDNSGQNRSSGSATASEQAAAAANNGGTASSSMANSFNTSSATATSSLNGSVSGNAISNIGNVASNTGGANGAGAGAGLDAGNGRTVYFDYDKSPVKEEYRSVVEANARRLAGNRSLKVMIEGHTDERGGHEYNLALGQRRAESVQAAMKLMGAGDSQMESVSFGKERPAVQGSNEAAWSKNRRAEIKDR